MFISRNIINDNLSCIGTFVAVYGPVLLHCSTAGCYRNNLQIQKTTHAINAALISIYKNKGIYIYIYIYYNRYY